ncbi:MAG: dTDP-4-dehydrorhamnose 3,5-epimerase [Saprospiraceae bacterium]|nr:dTDP-4-dehydrorhamnose 3,5-epimerase [Saprospiraceae bacterium]MCF8249712.1 dTDP-4-dehydrorhamnose 3,5-epimerase [Saprospiraceae bacterium]MCF8282498.1 dTDP-4-dehydrorhamnose 3,5-epimerase [Bacteroidales bacterium]MCF8314083.1 dTDP-4-dehydrorhamnose 3,5-epimerase [Saprospiraceae bacterium]MCF8442828.1 dTDP-4-dehydrorhamnose 3,5-epimerase [Saprospiraceae bacterium]
MTFHKTTIPDLLLIEPKVFGDDRGYFFESFNAKTWEEAAGFSVNFVQDNQAFSGRGVLRGLHYQTGNAAQAKLVRVLQGEVLDVVVDLREDSPTSGQYYKCRLSAENKHQLFVPRGFAHGYVVLSETAEFFYKCDNFYAKNKEGGIRYDCPKLNIDWEIEQQYLIVAERDKNFPSLGDHLRF